MEHINGFKAAVAAVVGCLTALWGWFGWLVVAWVVCMLLDYGTGTAAAIPGIDVAGKTGTAEKENGNDSWFVGMAPAEDPRVVVAIVIEDGEEGVGTAKAQNVLKTALEVQGLL